MRIMLLYQIAIKIVKIFLSLFQKAMKQFKVYPQMQTEE
jgi:hypothetical protein